jgi:enoyl-[acyl-carrier-protein] reductase (NADH)
VLSRLLFTANQRKRPQRAAARGLTPEQYFKSNMLQREVTAQDVADAFLYLATAKATTAAIITVDGGNISASVR